jgi:hypothetical protein
MSSVTTRVSALDEIGNPDAPEGSRPFCIYFAHQVKKARRQMETDVKGLLRMIGYLEQCEAWKVLGYPSESLMLHRECNLSMDDVDALRGAKPGATVGAVLGSHGGDRRSERAKENQGSQRTLKRGETAAYLRAKLARDHPDILRRLDAGEFRIVKAAAREAGIVRPTATFYTDDIDAMARAIKRTCGANGSRR